MTKGIVSLTGISESRVAPVAAHIAEEKGQSLILTATRLRAERLAKDLSFFVNIPVYVLPQEDTLAFRYEARDRNGLLERMKIEKELLGGGDLIVLAPICDAVKKLPPGRILSEKSFSLEVGDELDIEEVRNSLVAMGYERFNMIDSGGQFAIRGDIIDIYPPGEPLPVRIELFDTEVDAIRSFYPDTQRSAENLKSVEIYPAMQIICDDDVLSKGIEGIKREYAKSIKKAEKKESKETAENLNARMSHMVENLENVTNLQSFEGFVSYFYDETEYIWQYMQNGCIMIDDPDRICDAIETRAAEAMDDFTVLLERGLAVPFELGCYPKASDYYSVFGEESVYVFSPFIRKIKGAETLAEIHNLKSRQPISFNGKLDMLRTELDGYIRNGYEIVIACSTEERLANMREFLDRYEYGSRVAVKAGELTSGIEFPDQKKVWLSDGDIFAGHKTKKRRKARKDNENRIKNFADIKNGDFVVHENHGIGKFIGIKQLVVQGEQKDYLQIKYAGKDMLYVPVEQMDVVQKYSGSDGVTPKINKLSGGEWKKTKAKAKAAIAAMAADLIDLSAARSISEGYAFERDGEWQKEFEDSFPYAETDDQLKCVAEIKADMEKPEPMDRLLCGDVGFGKTEVAARALFKCVADGKQAAVLVPTTILANQHYYNLKERFERFPFKVDVLSRFKSDGEQKKTIEKVNEGKVDLLIGTHRMLSDDVKFKDLGLLVIDEEQRFGVQHKEKIKKLKNNIDVLTLSATPIPRTLHMSLSGIRDMSIIAEPPEERYPVQTYVVEQDDQVIRNVISRELDRGGQVYVVYNRVQGINQVAKKISDLVPDAEVAVGHGQMDEHRLEKVMVDFMDGNTNVLVATTIIENGLDISNVNTIIVLDTDRLGLSQLYQLRGRVGRSDKIAYAYFMYQPGKVLTQVAEKRLRAIKEFTEFGSGFKVAMRDLEIRGAGNVLGNAQSGHIVNIGYELYCKLVGEAIRALRGETVNESSEETQVEIQVSAYIPDRYIPDETMKLTMYKRIAEIHTKEDEEDIIEELLDRFGDIPKETVNLIKISRIRKLAGNAFIGRIHEAAGKVMFSFIDEKHINPIGIANVSEEFGMKVLFHGGVSPFLRLSTDRKNKLDDSIRLLEALNK